MFVCVKKINNNNNNKLHGVKKVQRSNEALRSSAHQLQDELGQRYNLLPLLLSPHSGKFSSSGKSHKDISLGARGDSYYEYLLKQWLLTDRSENQFLSDYQTSVEGIRKYLVAQANGYT
jgi:hypothetical protein